MDSSGEKVHPFIQHLIYTAAFTVSAIFLFAILFSLAESQVRQCLLSNAEPENRPGEVSATLELGRIINPWYADLFFEAEGWRRGRNGR